VLGDLLHGHEGRVYGDQAYKGQCQIIRAKAPQARDFTNRQCKWKHYVDQTIRAKNRTKSRIRSRVEHSIGVIKRVFGFTKVRYRALAKNANRVLSPLRWPTFFSFATRCWEQSVHSRETRKENLDLSKKSPRKSNESQ
jgi:transposase, IS5 family